MGSKDETIIQDERIKSFAAHLGRKYGHNSDDVNDIALSAIYTAYLASEKLNEDRCKNKMSFYFKCLENATLEYKRKITNKQLPTLYATPPKAEFENTIFRTEFIDLCRMFIKSLPTKLEKALFLLLLDEIPIPDIAKKLNMTTANVGIRMYRLRKLATEFITKYEKDVTPDY